MQLQLLLPSSISPAPRRRFKLIVLLLVVSVSGLGIGAWLQFYNQKRLVIDVNGSIREIRTHSATVGEALDEADIYLDPLDRVTPALETRTRSGMTIVVNKARQLVLEIDGEARRIYTHAIEPLVILSEQDVYLNPGDLLYVNHRLVGQNPLLLNATPNHLRIVRAKKFRLYEDGQLVIDSITAAATVGEVLDETNVQLFLADRVVPTPETPVIDGIVISIVRSNPVMVRVDGREVRARAIGTTVSEVLNMLGLALSGQDYTIPDENALFVADMMIEVVRVVETIEVAQESLPFQTLVVLDPALPAGEQKVIQAGIAGVRETRVRVRRENDRIVSRIVQASWIAVPPVPEIIAYGTKNTTPEP